MRGTIEIHQMLIERGFDVYEGVDFNDLLNLIREGKLTKMEAALVSLTCPQWERFKSDLGESHE